MSSMRNAVQRRNHRERAQPKEREKWGILEKHKDYSLRAADHKAKKARLRTLRQKAANRNPDEFYFGMMSAKMSKDGFKLGDRGNKALSQDTVRLLKTQDAGYLRLAAQKVKKETDALEEAFLLKRENKSMEVDVCGDRGQRGSGTKVVFVESREEQKGFVERVERDGRLGGGGEVEDQQEEEEEDRDRFQERERRKVRRAFERRKARLESSRTRQKQIEAAERELEMQRARMAKHPTVGGVNKWGVKWKVRERKK